MPRDRENQRFGRLGRGKRKATRPVRQNAKQRGGGGGEEPKCAERKHMERPLNLGGPQETF